MGGLVGVGLFLSCFAFTFAGVWDVGYDLSEGRREERGGSYPGCTCPDALNGVPGPEESATTYCITGYPSASVQYLGKNRLHDQWLSSS